MRFEGGKKWRDALKLSFTVVMQATRMGGRGEGREGGGRGGVVGIVKDFIGYLFSLYCCCFTCFIFIEIAKAKNAIDSILKFMRLTLNYTVGTVIFACTHPSDTSTFTNSLTRIHFLQLKMPNI